MKEQWELDFVMRITRFNQEQRELDEEVEGIKKWLEAATGTSDDVSL